MEYYFNGLFMKILAVLFLMGFAFSQDYDYPTYSEDDLPVTRFSCADKTDGGYYADIEADCQMYHVCSKDKSGYMKSTRFLCGNGTVFDQRHLVCQDYRRVQRCQDSVRYYRNSASILERLEARLRSEKRDKEILDAAEFDSNYDPPAYSEADLPVTTFSCKDKRNGGYYADIETDCQMYHVCSKDKFGYMRSTRFLCGNGTVFDQRHLVCQDYKKVQRCRDSTKDYRNGRPPVRGRSEGRFRAEKQDKEIPDPEIGSYYDSPTYSVDDLPVTKFSCKNKINGGYYADIETDCQMYHVCSKNRFGFMRSTRFLCGNGTVFDQRHLVCQDYNKVQRCKDSAKYYRTGPSILEHLEERFRSEKQYKEILDDADFDSGRLK